MYFVKNDQNKIGSLPALLDVALVFDGSMQYPAVASDIGCHHATLISERAIFLDTGLSCVLQFLQGGDMVRIHCTVSRVHENRIALAFNGCFGQTESAV
jgi:hypothetical protein